MIRLRVLSLLLTGLLVVPLAAQAQSAREQLNPLVQQLQSKPDDNALREQIIKLAKQISPPPAISENARKSFVEGSAIAKSATDASGQTLAVASFKDALNVAPWWGDAYYNLAVAQELAGQLDNAEASLKLYILTGPSAKDARDAQDHIYALEGKKRLAAQAHNTKAAAEAAEDAGRAKPQTAAPTTLICRIGFAAEATPTTIDLNEAKGLVTMHWGDTRNPGGRPDPIPGRTNPALAAKFDQNTIIFSPPGGPYDETITINRLTGGVARDQIDRSDGEHYHSNWTCHVGNTQF
jgi:hypothetical protein